MQLIDMHCDTLGKLLYGEMTQGVGTFVTERRDADKKEGKDLKHNDFCISIPGMQKAGTLVQFFACFTYVQAAGGGYEECYEDALAMMRLLWEQCERYGDEIAPALSSEDILKNERNGKISAILTVEEGGIINGKMERLKEIYEKGVRLITPMWNYENCFGYPNSRDREIMEKGLKPFGKEAVEYAGNLGMIVDVSHASDGTFQDILNCAKGPVVASHSNCRALCGHPRNLTDEMIRQLAEAGGVAGLNFYGAFLGGRPESRLEEMTAHVQHMIQIGGSNFPAVGTDFDGFDGMEYEDICRVDDMERLWNGLKKAGITESQLDKIWRKNAENVLKALPGS
ncbi:MAG: membrane dipeptidase [Eubacteriales bacterium]|nr:membrane dipeptidase [Eubacteriales bacterium]